MNKPPLLFYFSLALFSLLFGPLIFPSIRVISFAPFFAIILQRKDLLTCLWIAALCGLLIDLLSSTIYFGGFALCSLITVGIAERFKDYFFEDHFFSLSLNTALIAAIFSVVHLILTRELLTMNLPFVITTFFIMPIVDALYAFFWFTCPRFIYSVLINKWKTI